ncbi:MAG: helix-turn-helix domain-containing protein [Acidimicrobiia bacterium]|nr:helix-turn-helix domain-containing protein [Acidimicrobiia bacterium]
MTSEPMPDLPDVPDQMTIDSTAQLEALGSPMRMRILNAARKPRSVRDIAETLDVPATRLYYHVNLLHAHGFIEIVHTRKSGARLEKLYRVRGKSLVVGDKLAKSVEDPAMTARALTAVVLEPAVLEAETAVINRLTGEPEQPLGLGRSLAVLSPDEAKAISEKIEALIRDHLADHNDSDHPDAQTYAFTFTFLPTAPI